MLKARFIVCLISIFSCSNDEMLLTQQPDIIQSTENPDLENNTETTEVKILALGDSYTIGESVCSNCKFPEQLKSNLKTVLKKKNFELDIIAKTGWTTTNLKNAINTENSTNNYNLVTLLIGVNNQYQKRPFDVYKTEFPELLNKAISLGKGNSKNVIVISIPDYAYTPFGQSSSNPETISSEIDTYNEFAEAYCKSKNITFVTITDITRKGIENPDLVASDGLHPSELAYSKFVERLLPISIEKLN